MSDPRKCAEMSRRRARKSVISQRHGDNFMNSRPLSLTQKRKYHCSPIKPNLQQMSMSVSCLQARDELIKKHIKLIILFCASWNSWDQSDDAEWGKNDGRTRWTQCCGWRLLSWRSHLCCVSHDPLPGTPAREKSVAVSMVTGSAARAPEVVV